MSDVESPERLHGLGHKCLDAGHIRDVRLDDQNRSSGCLYLVRDSVGRVTMDVIVQGDGRALVREATHDARPDAE